MPDPQVIPIASHTVTMVAENIVAADIHILTQQYVYLHTYRVTGSAAPSAPTYFDDPADEWVRVEQSLAIRPSEAVDVYMYCDGTGSIRVDT